ncbi:MAG: hypothetical protein QOK10_666 [Pseudonocardiales bacterium]|jgi:hypothetical protein|nr:hypothetical protein [Pseudonocardiales bacterium]
MTQRIPQERDPRSPWIKGTAAIAAYIDMNVEEVGELLRTGELRGHQRKRGGTWRSHIDWMDAYLAGEEPPAITGRR